MSKTVVNAYKDGVPGKFGTQVERPRKIHVFLNGEPKHHSREILLSDKKFRTMDQLKIEMSKVLGMGTKPVMKIYDLEGGLAQITALDGFVDAGHYIACSSEPLFKDKLPKLDQPHREQAEVLAERKSPSKPTVAAYQTGVPDKFGTQTEKGMKITVYLNGDVNCTGRPILVHDRKFRTLDQLKIEMSVVLQIGTKPVMHVYDFDRDLAPITDLSEIADGGRYIAGSSEPLMRDKLPKALVSGDAPAPETPKSVASSTPRKSGGSIYDKLTDSSQYTGAHKERFDTTGHGKGKSGRTETAKDTGYVQGFKNAKHLV